MITIIDYDAGNMMSVVKAFEYLGQDVEITRQRSRILQASKVVLPGVGSFGDAMESLSRYDLVDTIRDTVSKGIPFIGICLGMQMLFDSSEESPGVTGLGLLPGKILRIPDSEGLKVPHMGWNSLSVNPSSRLFSGLETNPYVYFVHSYYLHAQHASDVAAEAVYGVNIHAAVEHENIFGCQFHPEKSSDTGLHILRNFTEVK